MASRGSRERGVTLMELLVVVIIIAVLASIAVPSYRSYIMRAHRTDATASLLKIRAAQEKFFLQNNRYADAAELTAAQPGGLGFDATSEHGYYTLSLIASAATSYTAEAAVTGGQADDTDCARFTVTDQGVRGAYDASDASNLDKCWR